MAERMVTEWGKQHRRELQEAWRRVESLWVPETRPWSLTCRYADRC